MPIYQPPIEDVQFLLQEVFDVDGAMAGLSDRCDSDLALTVLGAAGRFCADILEPLNRPGDEAGCRLDNGVVRTPNGFPEAYAAFAEAGWAGLSAPEQYGGQGLPRVVQILLDEMVAATNISFGLFPGLTRGAMEALAAHGSDGLKQRYLPKLATGTSTGIMALTEAGAGTDLGLLRTRAVPLPDGTYGLTGSKIFISSGDHDFGGNVVHLVLARLAGAPEGVKGISLFLVPKYLPTADSDLGPRNGVSVAAIERKMGLHAQPTCVMEYAGAVGWLVGEPNRGLNAMFTMMNAERLFVGVQALGLASAAYQKATAYARERRQGRSPDGTRAPVPIIEHPDVRRMLLTVRAYVEGCRALAVWVALQMDQAEAHPDSNVRQEASDFVALLTPVVKAGLTDLGFESTVLAQQVHGGHGYIRDTGIEQLVRDARITQIYEGTNGVQALDLAGRKLAMNGGTLPHRFFALVAADLEAARSVAGAERWVAAVATSLAQLEQATLRLQAVASDTIETGAAATDYLRLFALVALGWMWVRMGTKASGRIERRETSFDRAKVATADFYVARLLPQTDGLAVALAAGAQSVMAMELDAF